MILQRFSRRFRTICAFWCYTAVVICSGVFDITVHAQASTRAAATGGSRFAGAGLKENALRVQEIIDASQTVTPEFHARALLLLASSNLVGDPSVRLKLTREAFEVATGATKPVKRTLWVGLAQMGTDRSSEAWETFAGMLNLDRLSLQMKAIESTEHVNPALARRLLQELTVPEMPPVSCTDALVYAPDAYYSTQWIDSRSNR